MLMEMEEMVSGLLLFNQQSEMKTRLSSHSEGRSSLDYQQQPLTLNELVERWDKQLGLVQTSHRYLEPILSFRRYINTKRVLFCVFVGVTTYICFTGSFHNFRAPALTPFLLLYNSKLFNLAFTLSLFVPFINSETIEDFFTSFQTYSFFDFLLVLHLIYSYLYKKKIIRINLKALIMSPLSLLS